MSSLFSISSTINQQALFTHFIHTYNLNSLLKSFNLYFPSTYQPLTTRKMHLLTILAALFATTTAFELPTDLPSGVYAANLTTGTISLVYAYNATEIAPLVARTLATMNANTNTNPITRRGIPVAEKGCVGGVMNVEDLAAAYNLFTKWCDKGNQIEGGHVNWSVAGSAAWYGCSYGDNNPCGTNEIAEASTIITQHCNGVNRPGWVWMKDWKKSYGRENSGDGGNICGGLPKNTNAGK